MRSTRQRWISSIGRSFGCRRKRSLRMRRLSPAAGARSLLKSPLPSRFCRPYSCSYQRSRYTAVYFLPVVCFKSKLLAGCQNVRICSRLGRSPWFMLMINPLHAGSSPFGLMLRYASLRDNSRGPPEGNGVLSLAEFGVSGLRL